MQQKNKIEYRRSKKGLVSAVMLATLLPPAQANNDLTRPLVPMADYPFDYRTLNCWECFEAQGRMCHETNYVHDKIFDLLQSANRGDGVCCKNEVESGVCSPDNTDLVCSMPSWNSQEEQDNNAHGPVYSPNRRNYQMFAFCPGIEPQKCGVGDEQESLEFYLHAQSENPQTITTTEMNYREGTVKTREYDACHYMIVSGSMQKKDTAQTKEEEPAQSEEEKSEESGGRRLDGHEGEKEIEGEAEGETETVGDDGAEGSEMKQEESMNGEEPSSKNLKSILYVKVTAMDNMNVYIYGGPHRDQALQMVVPDNEMPTIDQLYTIDASEGDGFLIVAFPNVDSVTKLEFSYWEELVEVEESVEGSQLVEVEQEDDMMMLYGLGGVGMLFLCICVCVVCVIRKKRAMANKIGLELPPEHTDRQLFDQEVPASGRETNVQVAPEPIPEIETQQKPDEEVMDVAAEGGGFQKFSGKQNYENKKHLTIQDAHKVRKIHKISELGQPQCESELAQSKLGWESDQC